jgi:hypothetical protein
MIKTINDINLMEWFSDRKLSYVPIHFHKSSVPLTPESITWIEEKLVGRYAVIGQISNNNGIPYFEDKRELMVYELTFG